MPTCKTLLRVCSKQRQPAFAPLTQCRHESSTRRHKKLLALPEAPSYTSNRPEPTLIFNPPSSTPSVYHTPLKFLPKEDKRRNLYTSALHQQTTSSLRQRISPVAAAGTPLHTASHLPPRPSNQLPAPVRAPYEKKYHLTDKEIGEIKRLRLSDPYKWTRVKLAEKFGCSQFFVGMVVQARQKAAKVEKEHAAMRNKWGAHRREAKEDRARRKETWGRDA